VPGTALVRKALLACHNQGLYLGGGLAWVLQMPFCGSGLARDGITAVRLDNRVA